MRILILSKTRMGFSACVGGVVIDSGRYVRLLTTGSNYQPGNTPLEVGALWNIDFTPCTGVTPPHIEDVIVNSQQYIETQNNLPNYIRNSGVTVWEGSPSTMFEGLLGWTGNGSGYIGDPRNVPNNSVGFWSPNQSLALEGGYYHYPASNPFAPSRRLHYKGYPVPASTIAAGTLIRVSLAKWWSPNEEEIEKRCYLQLSGCYY